MIKSLSPTIRSGVCLLVVASTAALGLTSTAASGPPQPSVSVSQSAILTAINGERAKRHLAPLRASAPLNAAARQHSMEMAERGYFSHNSADSSSFGKRIVRFYSRRGYRRFSAGENILWSGASLTAAAAVDLWMHSPGHRRNILNPIWREIGISAVEETDAPGVYKGYDVVIVTTDFGVRSR